MVDLGRLSSRIETLMVDACTIHADSEHTGDDVLDPDTLRLEPPVGDDSLLYSGKCILRPPQRAAEAVEGGATVNVGRPRLTIPVSAPAIPVGARVTMTAATHLPELVDATFRVADVRQATLTAARTLFLEHRERVGDR